MELYERLCKNCGGSLYQIDEKHYKCNYCSSVFETESVSECISKMQKIIDDAKLEAVANARRNLYEAVNAENISSNRVQDCCFSLKQLIPDDFQANFYDIAVGNNVRHIISAIRKIRVSKDTTEIESIIKFLIRSLQTEYQLDLNNLISRTFESTNPVKYEYYCTWLANEAVKVDSGVYETKLPREVFVAYSSKDIESVSELVEVLESQGLKCFVSARNLRHGKGAVENYNVALEEAIDHCRAIVFVSSMNSRSFNCDALTVELPYVQKKDVENAPPEYKNNYKRIPLQYKKPRVEYRIGESTTVNVADAISNEIFDGYERAYTPEEVARRIIKQLIAVPQPETVSVPKKVKYCVECLCECEINLNACSVCKCSTFADTLKEAALLQKISNIEKSIQTLPSFDYNYSEGLEFELNEDEASYSWVGVGECKNIRIIVPPKYQGLPVTHIGDVDDFFYDNDIDIISISIPKSVSSIPGGIFHNLTSLSEIIIDEDNANYCSIDNVIYSKDYKSLVQYAVGKNDVRYEVINTTKIIDEYAFCGCTNLVEIILPDNIINIGEGAFHNCSNLASINIPNGVSVIEKDTFNCCENLKIIIIPNSVTSVGYMAFHNCSGVENVSISNGVTSIDDHAFSGCKSLTRITIPDSVISIGSNVFRECDSLESIIVNENNKNYKSIKGDLYSKDGAVLIQYSVGKSDQVFNIPNSVKSISDGAFESCEHLIDIIMSDNVTFIGDDIFGCCSNIKTIKLSKKLTHIGRGAFFQCSQLKNIMIPDGVTSIEDSTFFWCKNLESILLPNSILNIGEEAFCGCESITDISIPNSVTSIGLFAFRHCSNLTKIVVPRSVSEIGDYAFADCENLKIIEYLGGETKWNLNFNSNLLGFDDVKIVFKYDELEYALNDDGNSYSIIGIGAYREEKAVEIPSIYNGKPVTIIEDRAFRNCQNLTNIVIPQSIIKIGEYAFENCSKIESMIIPQSVRFIGVGALWGCASLIEFTIPFVGECETTNSDFGHLFTTDWYHFNQGVPSKLKSVVITGGKEIHYWAFKDCFLSISVTLPEGIVCICEEAFDCSNITRINIPKSVKSIGRAALHTSSLQEIVFENPVGWQRKGGGLLSKISANMLTNPRKAAETIKTKCGGGSIERI